MASYVSMAQFKELVRSIVDDQQYTPRRGRHQGDHPAGELFTAGGDRINNIKVKFHIEDDGGTWNDGTLVKPSFIWDMKKIISNSVIDDGSENIRANLKGYGVQPSNEGLKFFGYETSYLRTPELLDFTSLFSTGFTFNTWFRPHSFLQNYMPGIIFGISDLDTTSFVVVLIKDLQDPNRFKFHFVYRDTTSGAFIRVLGSKKTPLLVDRKYNLIINLQNNVVKAFINGEEILNHTNAPTLGLHTYGYIYAGLGFRGEIFYQTIGFDPVSETALLNYWKLGYPLPRKPEMVDLTDYSDSKDQSLLIDVRSVDKVLENLKGQFYVKTNSIKLRS